MNGDGEERAPIVQGDIEFRSLAAPGLEEDDLFAAMLAGFAASLWGQGHPPAFVEASDADDPATDRRRRHEELLRRWPTIT